MMDETAPDAQSQTAAFEPPTPVEPPAEAAPDGESAIEFVTELTSADATELPLPPLPTSLTPAPAPPPLPTPANPGVTTPDSISMPRVGRPMNRWREEREGREAREVRADASGSPGRAPAAPVKKVVLLNASEPGEIRVAILENGELTEIFMERKSHEQQAGNIYKGRVVNVEPSLQAAFVDLGTERNGFLHASDCIPPDGGYADILKKSAQPSRSSQRPESAVTAPSSTATGGGTGATSETAEGAAQAPAAPSVVAALPGEASSPVPPAVSPSPPGSAAPGQAVGASRPAAPGQPQGPFSGKRRRRRRGGRNRSGRGRPPGPAPMMAPPPGPPSPPGPSDEPQPDTNASQDAEVREGSEDAEIAPPPASTHPEHSGPDAGGSITADADRAAAEASEPVETGLELESSIEDEAGEPGEFDETDMTPVEEPASAPASADSEIPPEAPDEMEEVNAPEASEDEEYSAESIEAEGSASESDEQPPPLDAASAPDAQDKSEPGESAPIPVPGQPAPVLTPAPQRQGGRGGRDRAQDRRYTIQEMLRQGQEVLVQVAKEGIGQKGPALTTYLSMPGRYLVLMPAVPRLGVSKRIENEDQRRALKDALNQISPPEDMGVIVRTAGMGRSKDELQRDMNYLIRVWENLKKKTAGVKAPELIYQEGDVVTRVFRDVITDDVAEIVIDDPTILERAREFVRETAPGNEGKLKLHAEPEPLFHKYGVEQQMQRLFNRKVNLKNGGSIVIEQTEALVAIDVNTGRFREKRNQDDTILQTNLEAAREIARQLRLRDIGGLVMIDFIDMEIHEHRRRVERELKAHLARDKARINVLPVSQLGVVEMTRQRVRHSLRKTLFDRCPHCSGSGHIKSGESMGLEMLRELKSQLRDKNARRVKVLLNSVVAFAILNQFRTELTRLEEAHSVRIEVAGDPGVSLSQMQVSTAREGGDWVLKKVSEVDDYVRNP